MVTMVSEVWQWTCLPRTPVQRVAWMVPKHSMVLDVRPTRTVRNQTITTSLKAARETERWASLRVTTRFTPLNSRAVDHCRSVH
jgi:hypothetical protein